MTKTEETRTGNEEQDTGGEKCGIHHNTKKRAMYAQSGQGKQVQIIGVTEYFKALRGVGTTAGFIG